MKKIALRLTTLLVGMLCILSCDQDPTTIGQDLIGVDPNDIIKETEFEVTAYSQRLDAVQTGRQIVSTADRPHVLGIYDDPIYGRTEYSFVSQLSLPFANPDFGGNDTDPSIPEPIIESVSIEIPYYSRVTGIDESTTLYENDSLYNEIAPYKLEVFRNNYFLNNINPQDLSTEQDYYSDQKNLIENSLDPNPIYSITTFQPSSEEIQLVDEDGEITERLTPRLRIFENTPLSCTGCDDPDIQNNYTITGPVPELVQYFYDTIISQEGNSTLSSDSNFQNYFRGLYFKVTPSASGGNSVFLNLANANVNMKVLVFNKDTSDLDGDGDFEEIISISSNFRFGFGPRIVQFIDQEISTNVENEISSNSNSITGAERLFLKGGPGSVALVELFENQTEFEDFISNNWLINEAYLDLYVDQSKFTGIDGEAEPERIFVYNARTGEVLADYNLGSSSSGAVNSNTIHLGRLEREVEDDLNSRGIKYRIRLTNYLNTLIGLDNPTNDPLAVVVSQNVNVITGQRIKDATDSIELENVPLSTVIAPEGTVLHGNLSTDPDKRLQLKVFYTETN